jgi:hypothetical protein
MMNRNLQATDATIPLCDRIIPYAVNIPCVEWRRNCQRALHRKRIHDTGSRRDRSALGRIECFRSRLYAQGPLRHGRIPGIVAAPRTVAHDRQWLGVGGGREVQMWPHRYRTATLLGPARRCLGFRGRLQVLLIEATTRQHKHQSHHAHAKMMRIRRTSRNGWRVYLSRCAVSIRSLEGIRHGAP